LSILDMISIFSVAVMKFTILCSFWGYTRMIFYWDVIWMFYVYSVWSHYCV